MRRWNTTRGKSKLAMEKTMVLTAVVMVEHKEDILTVIRRVLANQEEKI